MNSVEELMVKHRSVRQFKDKKIDDGTIRRIIRCAQHASTSEFIQSYTVIHVGENIKKFIYDQIAGQELVLKAPVFLIFCADVNRLLFAAKMNGRKVPDAYLKYTETFLMASVDTAIMAQNAVLAAESEGIGCTYIGDIRSNLSELIKLLELPKGVYPLFGMVMGYPKEDTNEKAKPRLPLETVLKEGKYNMDGDEERLREYDKIIRQYYIDRTGGERDETWTMQMSDFVNLPWNPDLKEIVKKQGFELL